MRFAFTALIALILLRHVLYTMMQEVCYKKANPFPAIAILQIH